jgi:hypothetical protein
VLVKQREFKNGKEFERIVNLIVRFMNEIVIPLEVAPEPTLHRGCRVIRSCLLGRLSI